MARWWSRIEAEVKKGLGQRTGFRRQWRWARRRQCRLPCAQRPHAERRSSATASRDNPAASFSTSRAKRGRRVTAIRHTDAAAALNQVPNIAGQKPQIHHKFVSRFNRELRRLLRILHSRISTRVDGELATISWRSSIRCRHCLRHRAFGWSITSLSGNFQNKSPDMKANAEDAAGTLKDAATLASLVPVDHGCLGRSPTTTQLPACAAGSCSSRLSDAHLPFTLLPA